MVLLAREAVVLRLSPLQPQLHLGQVSLDLLDREGLGLELRVRAGQLGLQITCLPGLELGLQEELLDTLLLEEEFGVLLHLVGAEVDQLALLLDHLLVEHRVGSLQLVYVLEGPLVLALKVPVQRVHVVELLLELESELHLLLMSLDLLGELFLELLAEELLFQLLLLQLVLPLGQLIQGLLQVPLLLIRPLDLLIEVTFDVIYHLLVLLVELGDEHLIVGLAAVLQEDGKDTPEGGEQDVTILRVLQAFLQHLIEADAVDEEATVDAVH